MNLNLRGIAEVDARRFRAQAKLAGMTLAQWAVELSRGWEEAKRGSTDHTRASRGRDDVDVIVEYLADDADARQLRMSGDEEYH